MYTALCTVQFIKLIRVPVCPLHNRHVHACTVENERIFFLFFFLFWFCFVFCFVFVLFLFIFFQEKEVNGIKFWCYHAGHVLGAAMFMIEIAGVKVHVHMIYLFYCLPVC